MELEVFRKPARADSIRNYKVVLDGNVVGTVFNGERLMLPVSPGEHELYLKIDWCRSNKILFTVTENKLVFECQSNLTGFKIVLGLFFVFFFPSKYIRLRKPGTF